MKNILIVIDAEKLNVSDINFGCQIAKMCGSRLTGVFLENNPVGETPALKTVLGIPYVETIVASDLPGYNKRSVIREENMRFFDEICTEQGILHAAHLAKVVALDQIKSESRFADLLIINSSMHFEDNEYGEIFAFVSALQAHAECPVLVSSANFNGIDEIVFTYDGAAAASFAIRQFVNLFTDMGEKKITVVLVNNYLESAEENNLKQYLLMHYPKADFHQLNGDPGQELFKFLFPRKKALVVMGAYSRSKIYRSFFPSIADRLIKTLSIPIFIAHP